MPSFPVTTNTWLRCLLLVDVSDLPGGISATELYGRLENPNSTEPKISPVMIGTYLSSTQAPQFGASLVNELRGKKLYSTNPAVARVQLAQHPYVARHQTTVAREPLAQHRAAEPRRRTTTTTTIPSSTTIGSQQLNATVSNEPVSRRRDLSHLAPGGTPDGRGSRSGEESRSNRLFAPFAPILMGSLTGTARYFLTTFSFRLGVSERLAEYLEAVT
jgi:hypothetical protein